jgi:hypothetical protein
MRKPWMHDEFQTRSLDSLAQALRGMPRDAPMLVKLPDGTLADIGMVEPIRGSG